MHTACAKKVPKESLANLSITINRYCTKFCTLSSHHMYAIVLSFVVIFAELTELCCFKRRPAPTILTLSKRCLLTQERVLTN